MSKIRIGTRQSLLALVQTHYVADQLKKAFSDIEIEIVEMSTKGDERLNLDLSSFGGKGVFTKELEEALLSGSIDMAVHSAKDMPVALPEGLCVGAVFEREDVRDVIVTLDGTKIRNLPRGAVVGTGSLRRELQIRHLNPDVCVRQIRGNVQTRLRKLAAGDYDAIVLAAAGLHRLGYEDHACLDNVRFEFEYLNTAEMLPAACQGILAVETRETHKELLTMLSQIASEETHRIFDAERSFLTKINGGCNAPAAALAVYDQDGCLRMDALYIPEKELTAGALSKKELCAQIDRFRISMTLQKDQAVVLGQTCAGRLLGQ